MTISPFRSFFVLLPIALSLGACSSAEVLASDANPMSSASSNQNQSSVLVHYLEIVTPDVETTCAALESIHGVSFGEPNPGLGNARSAAMADGGMIGVRAPMAEHDLPIVRPYLRVEDIGAALSAAEAAGAVIAMGATEIPGGIGQFAIYFLGETQFGLWQL